MSDDPCYIMLIGPPGVGKSTFAREFLSRGHLVTFSSDAEIEEYASVHGLTYNEAFKVYGKRAVTDAKESLQFGFINELDIIDDHTNMSVKKRTDKLKNVPKCYTKIALVFGAPELDEWDRRLDSRPGKIIPDSVIDSMILSYSPPSLDEGFDHICFIHQD